ncbi:hypothetical protein GGS23DRAFT_129566 [Durotheca rogersii]|uniref:uncharacterized protein n=1 Tax=Durotheca rogersii TaxID=419775 RepID=UPI00221F1EC4|nr:uncharacterized protein GGS23DRAFT_129566 [Durotheca rogersii]KAI5861741.1 hypothetical protein GGS23DRAFT_129566 [Durotheca rogersii]
MSMRRESIRHVCCMPAPLRRSALNALGTMPLAGSHPRLAYMGRGISLRQDTLSSSRNPAIFSPPSPLSCLSLSLPLSLCLAIFPHLVLQHAEVQCPRGTPKWTGGEVWRWIPTPRISAGDGERWPPILYIACLLGRPTRVLIPWRDPAVFVRRQYAHACLSRLGNANAASLVYEEERRVEKSRCARE